MLTIWLKMGVTVKSLFSGLQKVKPFLKKKNLLFVKHVSDSKEKSFLSIQVKCSL